MADQTSRFGLNMPVEDEYINESRTLYNNNFEAIDALLGAPARETAPLNPGSGQIYSVPSTKRLKIYLNGVWEDIRVVGDVLSSAEIPNLNASKITAGTLDAARIPNLNASKITAGVLNTARIPNLSASKITSGTLADARMGASTSSSANTVAKRTSNGQLQATAFVAGPAAFTVNSSTLRLSVGGYTLDMNSTNGRLNHNPSYDNPLPSGSMLMVNSSGLIARQASSRRYKENIRPAEVLPQVLDLEPKLWNPKDSTEDDVNYGLIAEDLHELGLSHLVVYDNEGRPDGIHYHLLGVALLPIVKSLAGRIDELERRLDGIYDY